MALEHRIVLIIEQSHETEDIVVVVQHYSCLWRLFCITKELNEILN